MLPSCDSPYSCEISIVPGMAEVVLLIRQFFFTFVSQLIADFNLILYALALASFRKYVYPRISCGLV